MQKNLQKMGRDETKTKKRSPISLFRWVEIFFGGRLLLVKG